MEPIGMTTMLATVCRVWRCALCVCDHSTDQEVIVHYDCACCFRPGERVCIHYDGVMTRSIPPQINAICVERVGCR